MLRKPIIAVIVGGLGLSLLAGCGKDAKSGFTVERVAQAGRVFQNPLDAVPGNNGATYFTADGPSGPGVFAAASSGGAPTTPVAVGRPFRRPVGIAMAADGASLYVADTLADTVFTLPVGGGSPVALPGTSGLQPRGVEVKGGLLYLTGVDPQSGTPAVFSLPAGGGPATVLASGLSLPDGIAVADDGTVFVTDRFGGRVLRVAAGMATPLAGVSDVVLGQPAGLALSADGASLLVSSLHARRGSAQVLVVDIASGTSHVFDDVIGKNHGAGGLHRAADGSAFAWADSTASSRGSVYRLHG